MTSTHMRRRLDAKWACLLVELCFTSSEIGPVITDGLNMKACIELSDLLALLLVALMSAFQLDSCILSSWHTQQ